MNRRFGIALCSLALVVATALALSPACAERVPLNTGWLFQRGDISGAEQPGYRDRSWRKVVVPHDWSIEDVGGHAPFDAGTPGAADSGYMRGGIGWYRRHIALDAKAAAGVVVLRFEAVYMDADIWVNGARLATHHYGYTAFAVDLTGHVHAGDNVVAVRVNHQDPSSRWYAGSGIIRPVALDILSNVHIASDGPAVATPVATEAAGEVAIETPVQNRLSRPVEVTLTSAVVDAAGRTVRENVMRQTVAGGAVTTLAQRLTVDHPALWSLKAPNLYRAVQTLTVDGAVADRRETRFGIRTLSFDAEHGLLLNGERVLLRGGNIHHDNYMVGAAGIPRADERKVELMKAAGYNAIRNAHNPASQATLDTADRIGMLVIDEAFDAWAEPKRPMDYARFFAVDWQADIDSLVTSGRNHPSVVMWSIGNEIPEQKTPEGAARAHMIASRVRSLDATRPVTAAVNGDGPEVAPYFEALDIGGYNYRWKHYASDHVTYPKRVIFGTESFPDEVFENWQAVKSMPWVVGDFVWTAFDYLGEASIGWTGYTDDWKHIGPYPWHLAYCGEIDATGRMLPAAYYRAIVWGKAAHPVAAFVRWPDADGSLPGKNTYAGGHREWVMPDLHQSWSWGGREGKPLDVVVYSELPEVELFLNGKSLGRRPVGESTKYQVEYSVPYEAGVLKAVGYRDGAVVSEWVLKTAGAPAAIRLSVDRSRIAAGGTDISYVAATLVDAGGTPIYATPSDRQLSFRVAGAGTLAGAGNGNPIGTESLQSGVRTSFHSRAVAAVRSGAKPGRITVTVTAPGLKAAKIEVEGR